MSKDPNIIIEHVLESINLIERYIKGKSIDDFYNDVQLQDSVIRRMEIIGEAIKNLPDDVREKYTDITWKEIVGMRDVLIHAYFRVDLDLTWETIQNDIPILKEQLNKIKDEL